MKAKHSMAGKCMYVEQQVFVATHPIAHKKLDSGKLTTGTRVVHDLSPGKSHRLRSTFLLTIQNACCKFSRESSQEIIK